MDALEKLREIRDACILQQARYISHQVEVGEFTYGQPIIHRWDDTTKLKIGKFCSIAGNVYILLGGEHHTEWLTTYPFDVLIDDKPTHSKGDVIIGNDVWIGENVTILSGVTIGDGAVIGAGAVVSNKVQPYEVVGGIPAGHIRWRDAAEQIEALQWWDWPMEKIAEAIPMLTSKDVHGMIDFDRRWKQ